MRTQISKLWFVINDRLLRVRPRLDGNQFGWRGRSNVHKIRRSWDRQIPHVIPQAQRTGPDLLIRLEYLRRLFRQVAAPLHVARDRSAVQDVLPEPKVRLLLRVFLLRVKLADTRGLVDTLPRVHSIQLAKWLWPQLIVYLQVGVTLFLSRTTLWF